MNTQVIVQDNNSGDCTQNNARHSIGIQIRLMCEKNQNDVINMGLTLDSYHNRVDGKKITSTLYKKLHRSHNYNRS